MRVWIFNELPGAFRIVKGAEIGEPQMTPGVVDAYPVERLKRMGLVGVYATSTDYVVDLIDLAPALLMRPQTLR
jgi:hypothetical protein